MLHPNLGPFCLKNLLRFICVKQDVVILTSSYSQFPIAAFPVSMLDAKSILWSMNKELGCSKGGCMCNRSSAYYLAIRLTASSHCKSEGLEIIYTKIGRLIIAAT
jgi:hypothetical protein